MSYLSRLYTMVKKENQNHLGINLDEGYVPGTTYFYIDNDQIIGTINIRHCLNDFLLKKVAILVIVFYQVKDKKVMQLQC